MSSDRKAKSKPDSKAARSSKSGQPELSDLSAKVIGRRLQQLMDDTEQEGVPDQFRDLIERLRQGDDADNK